MRTGELIAQAFRQTCSGEHQCVFCGAPASLPYQLKSSFTARSSLVRPGSQFCCVGCEISMRESGTVTYLDGVVKPWNISMMRGHSWWLEPSRAVPLRWQDKAWLYGQLLNPPAGPWLACISPGGQKHQLFCSQIGSVSLDGEIVDYSPSQLRSRRSLCVYLGACVGAVGLENEPGPSLWGAVTERYGDSAETALLEWLKVWGEPLSRLAVYFTPKKEDCISELESRTVGHAGRGSVSA
jgi:hypothetical protein